MSFKDYGLIQDFGYLFLIIIISANICVVESTRCPYCNEDFVSLGRHTWRCRARRTSTAPVPTVDSTVNEDNINNGRPGNHSILPTVSQNQDNVAYVKCSCGRLCKGRRGLRAHQRSCAIHESLSKINDSDSDNSHHTADVNHFDSADGSSFADPINEFNIDMSENNENTHAQYKPGIKLPKTSSDWAMANAYFQSIFVISSIPTNFDHFVEEAQNKIYDYVRSTYGSVENDDASDDYFSKYNSESVKSLKSILKQLKSSKAELQEIRFVSKLIRSKLNKSDVINAGKQLEKSLKLKFWSACNDIFNKATNSVPTFAIDLCSSYFRRVLSVFSVHSLKTIPSWIPSLQSPTTDFDDSPPTYKEVATAVNRCRRSSSACPLDQISIIILQKCAFLRSLLHAMIVECWKRKHAPRCWKRSATILIFKKGDTSDPSNFRPITLQPVLYKILATIIRKKMFEFLDQNKLIDKKLQKGFWPAVDGVSEHTETLTHAIRDSKRHQRGLVITLLDLKNAFGEVHHDLIRTALQYHHLPDHSVHTTFQQHLSGCSDISDVKQRIYRIHQGRERSFARRSMLASLVQLMF